MAPLRVGFQRGRNVETFPWARVEAMRDGVQLTLRVPRQIHVLWQVLAQQPVGVLVCAALPGAMRVGKKDLDAAAGPTARARPFLCPDRMSGAYAVRRVRAGVSS